MAKNKWSGKYNGKRYDLHAKIMRELTDYTYEVSAGIEKAADRVSRDAVKTLKQNSPRSDEAGAHYADGWTKRKTKGNGKLQIVIYNRIKPHLTHLMEFGWITKDGTRVEGREHITPVKDKLAEDFPKLCEEIVKGAGK